MAVAVKEEDHRLQEDGDHYQHRRGESHLARLILYLY
jgi:hypothetical protein